jgi:5'-methylthioadenosine phosphorylase
MVGVIGGTGLGQALGAVGAGKTHDIDTPFGPPSAPIVTTEVGGVPVALLPRHGNGHVHSPSQIPYRANIYALKKLGVTHILAGSAVGSLREEIAPKHLVIPDQVIDKTFRRVPTFFDEFVAHVEFAQPFSPELRTLLIELSAECKTKVHTSATYVCMEGPQFSTKAESLMHRAWGAHLIGMTVMPEAKLAREAEIAYGMVAMATDYDCWRPHEGAGEHLLAEIVGNLKEGTVHALDLIRRAIPEIARRSGLPCAAHTALKNNIFTDQRHIPEAAKRRLSAIVGKYLG